MRSFEPPASLQTFRQQLEAISLGAGPLFGRLGWLESAFLLLFVFVVIFFSRELVPTYLGDFSRETNRGAGLGPLLGELVPTCLGDFSRETKRKTNTCIFLGGSLRKDTPLCNCGTGHAHSSHRFVLFGVASTRFLDMGCRPICALEHRLRSQQHNLRCSLEVIGRMKMKTC